MKNRDNMLADIGRPKSVFLFANKRKLSSFFCFLSVLFIHLFLFACNDLSDNDNDGDSGRPHAGKYRWVGAVPSPSLTISDAIRNRTETNVTYITIDMTVGSDGFVTLVIGGYTKGVSQPTIGGEVLKTIKSDKVLPGDGDISGLFDSNASILPTAKGKFSDLSSFGFKIVHSNGTDDFTTESGASFASECVKL
ncbi:hypothetical protein P0082_05970 [Candidatus Haliotispira prima]|uniref:Lipoprotein n=1 Tax=Candidatus Haliotispira prima TaxID=3034016 RepID=A0ABY8MMI7_9SPIO|nr:hypothetical protein P0082_05970 [Candidatus Haliotispira prima]